MPSKKYGKTASGKLIPKGSDIFDEYVEGWNDCVDSLKKDYMPIDFIDKQIDRYSRLFEESLYRSDEYDEHYRMMADALKTLKKRWKNNDR